MPNWCENVLVVAHKDPAMVSRAVKALEAGRLLEEFVPMQEEFRKTESTSCDPAVAHALAEKYGYADWYEWRLANWGCKWDVGGGDDAMALESNDPNRVELCFASPWSPPVAAYPRLEELGFAVEAFYYEKGRGFCGRYHAGADTSYDIEGGSEWVRANIPAVIDDAFAISDNMESDAIETKEVRHESA